MPDLLIRDQELSGKTTSEFSLTFLTERITVRELIRSRVYQEVQDHNHSSSAQKHRSLVVPTQEEQLLNGRTGDHRIQVDWQAHFRKATEAFEAGRIIILVNDQQTDSLDEELEITTSTVVKFLRLTLLVGG